MRIIGLTIQEKMKTDALLIAFVILQIVFWVIFFLFPSQLSGFVNFFIGFRVIAVLSVIFFSTLDAFLLLGYIGTKFALT